MLKQLLTLTAVPMLCSQPSAGEEKRNLRVAYMSPSYSQSINWIAKERREVRPAAIGCVLMPAK